MMTKTTKLKTFILSKLKALEEDKSNVAFITMSVFDRVESITGKEENAGYKYFLLFTVILSKVLFHGGLQKL